MTKKNKILRLISYTLPLIIFTPFVIIFQSLGETLIDITIDNRSVFDYGFAVYIALTSVLFGWLRSEDDESLKKGLKLVCIISLYTSAMFLIVLALKYLLIYDNANSIIRNYSVIKFFLQIIGFHNYISAIAVIYGIFILIIQFLYKNYKDKV